MFMSLPKEQEFKHKIPKMDLKMLKLRKKILKQKQQQTTRTNKRNKSLNNNLRRMITCKAITLRVKLICKMTKSMNNTMIMKMMSDFYQVKNIFKYKKRIKFLLNNFK